MSLSLDTFFTQERNFLFELIDLNNDKLIFSKLEHTDFTDDRKTFYFSLDSP
jgi:beta-mannosidase